jgi:hypothetical protein
VDFGIKWVVLGHSERREYFKEDNEMLKKKLGAAHCNLNLVSHCSSLTCLSVLTLDSSSIFDHSIANVPHLCRGTVP